LKFYPVEQKINWLIFQNFSLYFPSLRKSCEKNSLPLVLATHSNITITDNSRQFIDWGLAEFYDGLGIKHISSFVEHPQTNGKVEATNNVILNGLKKRLGTTKGKWTKELVEVLWVYRCTSQTTTQKNPYILTYDTQATIPGKPSLRRQIFDVNLNQEILIVDLDLINEYRDKIRII